MALCGHFPDCCSLPSLCAHAVGVRGRGARAGLAPALALELRTPVTPMNRTLPNALALAISVTACAGAEPLLTHTDVFLSGKDGYHTYRIPALEAAPDGSLIAFAEARKYNAADPGFGRQDIDLVFKRSTNNGATWSPMTVLEDPGELWSAANPATVVDRTSGIIRAGSSTSGRESARNRGRSCRASRRVRSRAQRDARH